MSTVEKGRLVVLTAVGRANNGWCGDVPLPNLPVPAIHDALQCPLQALFRTRHAPHHPFAVWRREVLYLQVLGVGGFNLVSPESTDDNTGDADVERDLSPEVGGLCKLLVSAYSC